LVGLLKKPAGKTRRVQLQGESAQVKRTSRIVASFSPWKVDSGKVEP
jgi:hypothetical protein